MFRYQERQFFFWTHFMGLWLPSRSSSELIVIPCCHHWGIWHCMAGIPPTKSSSAHSLVRRTNSVSKMGAFYGEAKLSFPKQDMWQWWGNYMKDILVFAEWRALHVALHGAQELMPTWREWWKTAISKSPAPAPLHSSKWPTRPWACIHIDFAGPFLEKQFLVVVDAHSKWLEVVPALNLTSQTTIGTLRSILATHGLPELLVSDNRSSFTSAEFHESMKHNGIHHITSCPLPSSIQWAGQKSHSDFQDRTGENYINRCSNFLSKISVPIPDNTPQHNWSLPSRAINGSMTSLTPRSHASIHRDLWLCTYELLTYLYLHIVILLTHI